MTTQAMMKNSARNIAATILNPLIALLRATATVLLLATVWLPLLLDKLVELTTQWMQKTENNLWKY